MRCARTRPLSAVHQRRPPSLASTRSRTCSQPSRRRRGASAQGRRPWLTLRHLRPRPRHGAGGGSGRRASLSLAHHAIAAAVVGGQEGGAQGLGRRQLLRAREAGGAGQVEGGRLAGQRPDEAIDGAGGVHGLLPELRRDGGLDVLPARELLRYEGHCRCGGCSHHPGAAARSYAPPEPPAPLADAATCL